MTTAERNHLVLTLLEVVTPLIHKYTSAYRLDFEEMYQDASIAIMSLLDAGIDDIQNLPAYVTLRVKSRIINKLGYTERRRMISLDAPIGDEEDSATLADLVPSPYQVEPLSILLTQERLQELYPILAERMNPNRRRAIRECWETASASL